MSANFAARQQKIGEENLVRQNLGGVLIAKKDDLYPLFGLPAASALIFRWEWQKFLRASMWTAFDLLAAYTVLLAWSNGKVRAWSTVLVASAVQTVFVIVLAALLAAWRPSRIYGSIVGIAFTVAIIGTMAHKFVAPYFFSAIETLSPALNFLLPAGWISLLAVELVADKPDWSALFFAMPSGVIFVTLPLSQRRLLRTYEITEAPEPGEDDDEEHLAEAPLPPAEPGPVAGPTEVIDAVRDRTFLRESPLEQVGRLERAFQSWLTTRERWLTEMMAESPLSWSHSWKRALVFMVVGLLIGRLWQQIAPRFDLAVWLVYLIVGAITALLVLPVGSGLGRGFESLILSGTHVPRYAGFPVGYFEIARVILKSDLIRSLCGAPVVVACGAIVFWFIGMDPFFGALLGLKITWIVLAASLAAVALRFSGGTNDTRRFNLVAVVLIVIGIPAGLAFAGLGISLVFFRGEAAWTCAALLPVPSYIFYRFYGWIFNRNRFDLMSRPAQTWG